MVKIIEYVNAIEAYKDLCAAKVPNTVSDLLSQYVQAWSSHTSPPPSLGSTRSAVVRRCVPLCTTRDHSSKADVGWTTGTVRPHLKVSVLAPGARGYDEAVEYLDLGEEEEVEQEEEEEDEDGGVLRRRRQGLTPVHLSSPPD